MSRPPPLRPAARPRAPSRRSAWLQDPRSTFLQVGAAAGGVMTVAGLVQQVGADPGGHLTTFVVAAAGAVGLALAVHLLAEPHDVALVRRAAIAGVLLRVGLALLVHANVPEGFFAPDQITYQDVGWRTLQAWRGDGALPWQVRGTSEVGYFYWNAFLFAVFGYVPLAPKLANAFVGTATALVAYRIAGELAGKEPARNTLVLVALFPSMVLWSALNLRDPAVLLVTVSLFLAALRLRVRPTAFRFLGVVGGVALLFLLRDYLAVMAILALVGSSVLGRARGLPANAFAGLVLLGIAILAYERFGLGARWIESASFEVMARQRQALAIGGSAFLPEADVSTPLRGLRFLPVGLVYFLLGPFPWRVTSTLSLMTLPEMLVWYALLPRVATGGLYVVRRRFQAFGPTLVFLVVTTVVYALVEGNVGTAYRHRAQVLVFFLILAGVGIALRSERARAEPRAARAGDPSG